MALRSTHPKPPTPPMPPGRELLYQELQREYDKTLGLRDSLDGKANNMITISSAVATLAIWIRHIFGRQISEYFSKHNGCYRFSYCRYST